MPASVKKSFPTLKAEGHHMKMGPKHTSTAIPLTRKNLVTWPHLTVDQPEKCILDNHVPGSELRVLFL